MPRDLILVTDSFPFGYGEEFLVPELEILSLEFSRVFIIPNKYNGNKRRVLNISNVFVLIPLYRSKLHSFVSILFNFSNLDFIISEYFNRLKAKNLYNFSRLLIVGLKARAYNQILRSRIRSNHIDETAIIYFYWGNYPAISSILLSRRNPCVVRYHGGDLYEELKQGSGHFHFREQLLKKANLNLFVSRNGYEYAISKYPIVRFNYLINRLGVKEYGISEFSRDGIIRIISCSNVNYNKRVGLILEAMSLLDIQVEWTHFGTGPEYESLLLKSQSINSNITCYFRGQVSNKDVREHYIKNKVDLFINVSLSEGIPASIMEALSAGVPVMATDVGGTSELVDSTVGYLLDKTIDANSLAKEIIQFSCLDFSEVVGLRQNAHQKYLKLACPKTNFKYSTSIISSYHQ